MAESGGRSSVWEGVLELTKWAQHHNADPLLWSIQLTSALNAASVRLPSPELAYRLVSHICWDNHVPITWKLLEKSISVNIAPPLLVLSLLSSAVIPCRRLHPSAFRLYLDLLNRHAFSSLSSTITSPNYRTVMDSVDAALQLSKVYGTCGESEDGGAGGVVIVRFVFTVVWQLVEASLEDEGLLEHKPRWWMNNNGGFGGDGGGDGGSYFSERKEGLQRANTAMAIETIARFISDKVTSRILSLVHRNMPNHWAAFVQQLQRLAANSLVLRNMKHVTPESLLPSDLKSNKGFKLLSPEWKTTCKLELNAVMAAAGGSVQSCNDTWSLLWLPIDLILEDAMDGDNVAETSFVLVLSGMVKALKAVNGTSWHNAFLGLWIAALRLVQRERDPSEGPVPRLDTCLCMLLCITTLVVANIIEEEEGELMEEAEHSPTNQSKDNQALGERREELVTCLQVLGNYEGILNPPQSVTSVANQAAAKAAIFVSGHAVGNGYLESMNVNDLPTNYSGNLWHLIVEACIARKLIDTTAYFWPGYVSAPYNQLPHSIPNHLPSWSSFVKGSPLTPQLVNVLVATPASSLAEIEKFFEFARNGSDEEKLSAVTVLCGASLVRGWNVQ
ncbi:hypothetical protein PIB30_086775, partial [Stylosanthes scabra]|nr:hypothetical protein [Stylosanthes scabra]